MKYLHTKKFIIKFMVIAMIIVILLCKFLSWNEMKIKKINISGIQELTEEDGAICYFDESNEIEGERLDIRGWFLIKGYQSTTVNLHILLKNNTTNDCYELPTAILTRTDVTENLNDGIDYDNSGFYTNAYNKKFDFENSSYEIAILYETENNKYLYNTGSVVGKVPEGVD